MMKIFFVGGGSLGHIAPCVAVWRAIEKKDRPVDCHFVCSDRIEDRDFLEAEGIPHTAVGPRRMTVLNILPTFFRALRLLRHHRPNIIFTKGGGVTIPVAYAAKILNILIIVHESDAVPGRATQWIARFATKVCYGFPNNPIRRELTQGSKERGRALTGFTGQRPILLVIGGSQGAAAINDAIAEQIDSLLKYVDIAHLTGEGKEGAHTPYSGYWTRPFAHRELADLYALADFAVSRAGAGSIAELAANGIPAILVPLPNLAQNHQEENACVVERIGGCIVLLQDSLKRGLVGIVEQLSRDSARRAAMKNALQKLHRDDAAEVLADIILEHAK